MTAAPSARVGAAALARYFESALVQPPATLASRASEPASGRASESERRDLALAVQVRRASFGISARRCASARVLFARSRLAAAAALAVARRERRSLACPIFFSFGSRATSLAPLSSLRFLRRVDRVRLRARRRRRLTTATSRATRHSERARTHTHTHTHAHSLAVVDEREATRRSTDRPPPPPPPPSPPPPPIAQRAQANDDETRGAESADAGGRSAVARSPPPSPFATRSPLVAVARRRRWRSPFYSLASAQKSPPLVHFFLV